MRSKTLAIIAGIIIAFILLAGTCAASFAVGWFLSPNATNSPNLSILPNPTGTTSQPQGTDDLFVPFWESWNYVHDLYVDQPVNDEAMMQGAIKGMLDSLGDQHTSYMDPLQYQNASTDLQGEYEGIGAWVNTDSEYLTISEPMKGSPAEKAGLKPGDQIIAIDGEDMTGIFPELARQKVLGPAGSKVVLTIQRGELEPFDVEVTRASITVASVESEMLEGNIAYVRLRNFGSHSTDEMRAALTDLMAQDPEGLIFDLRNNPGGGLQTAVEIASQFIEGGNVVLYEEYGDGTRVTHQAIQGGLATDIPLVVLVNEYSASASEVVAGAIQDYERGQLVGETTFGKGSVQQWIPLSNSEGAVRITVARWLTPNERQIHEVGLTPDVVVTRDETDTSSESDPQLDTAIEILTQK